VYQVALAPDCLAIDTSAKISPAMAKLLASSALPLPGESVPRPVRGIGRYVGLHAPEPGDIDELELTGIIDAGLGLWLVQHCLSPGWTATADLGDMLGRGAVECAKRAGYMPESALAFDLEGVANISAPVIACCEAWAAQVSPYYQPLLYVGFQCGLSPDQLYSLPSFARYWSDAGPRVVSKRGFCAKQHVQTAIHGVPVDPDWLSADQFGDRMRWMIDAPAPSLPPVLA